MNTLQAIFSTELIEALGWTIVHSLWQGTVVALGLSILLLIMRKNSAQVRYFLSFIALIIVLVWSSVTFVHSYNYAHEKQEIKEKIAANPDYVKTLLTGNESEKQAGLKEKQETINIRLIKVRSYFLRHFNLICTFWLIGMLFLITRMVGGFIFTYRLRNYQLVPLADEWIHKIDEMAEKLGIKRAVRAFFSPLAKTPMTLGTLKPIILFPVSAFTGLPSKEIEAIIAHELAHVLRHDYLFNILQSIVEILFFYHPAVWIISSQIRNERENSCDNKAIETTGDKVAFVKALAAIQINNLREEKLAMAFSPNKNSVLQRIKRLQKQVAMKTNFIEGLIAAGVIVIGLTLASITMGSPINTQMSKEEKSANVVPVTAKRTEVQKDSIQSKMIDKIEKSEKDQQNTEELEKVVEVALSEQDEDLSAEMAEEINHALDEINVDEIVREAMHEAAKAMREASVDVEEAMNEIDREDINRDMREAASEIEQAKREMAHDMRHDMSEDGIDEEVIEASIKAATAGLDVAAVVVGSLDIEGIVSAALKGVSAGLNSMGHCEDDTFDVPHNQHDADYKTRLKEIETEKKMLEKEQQKLQKRVDQLDKKLEQMEK
jgi:beta-lactamase regulating signal transducer with metallopeptidase domain